MEFVCPVADGIEIGAACHQRIHSIIDRNEAYSLLREVDFRIVTHLQVLTTESAEVFDDQSFHLAIFNHLNDLLPGRPLEVCAGVAIISKEYDILKAVIFCVLLKQNALIDNAVGVAHAGVLLTESSVENCVFINLACHCFTSLNGASRYGNTKYTAPACTSLLNYSGAVRFFCKLTVDI